MGDKCRDLLARAAKLGFRNEVSDTLPTAVLIRQALRACINAWVERVLAGARKDRHLAAQLSELRRRLVFYVVAEMVGELRAARAGMLASAYAALLWDGAVVLMLARSVAAGVPAARMDADQGLDNSDFARVCVLVLRINTNDVAHAEFERHCACVARQLVDMHVTVAFDDALQNAYATILDVL